MRPRPDKVGAGLGEDSRAVPRACEPAPTGLAVAAPPTGARRGPSADPCPELLNGTCRQEDLAGPSQGKVSTATMPAAGPITSWPRATGRAPPGLIRSMKRSGRRSGGFADRLRLRRLGTGLEPERVLLPAPCTATSLRPPPRRRGRGSPGIAWGLHPTTVAEVRDRGQVLALLAELDCDLRALALPGQPVLAFLERDPADHRLDWQVGCPSCWSRRSRPVPPRASRDGVPRYRTPPEVGESSHVMTSLPRERENAGGPPRAQKNLTVRVPPCSGYNLVGGWPEDAPCRVCFETEHARRQTVGMLSRSALALSSMICAPPRRQLRSPRIRAAPGGSGDRRADGRRRAIPGAPSGSRSGRRRGCADRALELDVVGAGLRAHCRSRPVVVRPWSDFSSSRWARFTIDRRLPALRAGVGRPVELGRDLELSPLVLRRTMSTQAAMWRTISPMPGPWRSAAPRRRWRRRPSSSWTDGLCHAWPPPRRGGSDRGSASTSLMAHSPSSGQDNRVC